MLPLPTPSDIVQTAASDMANGTLPGAIGASLRRVLIGYFVGSGLAIILGSAMGWFKRIEYLLGPLVEIIRPIPALAYIPLVILWFGIGRPSKITVIATGAFVGCVVNVTAARRKCR